MKYIKFVALLLILLACNNQPEKKETIPVEQSETTEKTDTIPMGEAETIN